MPGRDGTDDGAFIELAEVVINADDGEDLALDEPEIGRASCRERV